MAPAETSGHPKVARKTKPYRCRRNIPPSESSTWRPFRRTTAESRPTNAPGVSPATAETIEKPGTAAGTAPVAPNPATATPKSNTNRPGCASATTASSGDPHPPDGNPSNEPRGVGRRLPRCSALPKDNRTRGEGAETRGRPAPTCATPKGFTVRSVSRERPRRTASVKDARLTRSTGPKARRAGTRHAPEDA